MSLSSIRGTVPRIVGSGYVGRDGRNSERITTTLSKAKKAELEALASKHKVSAAWLQRLAIERLLEQPQLDLPLQDLADA